MRHPTLAALTLFTALMVALVAMMRCAGSPSGQPATEGADTNRRNAVATSDAKLIQGTWEVVDQKPLFPYPRPSHFLFEGDLLFSYRKAMGNPEPGRSHTIIQEAPFTLDGPKVPRQIDLRREGDQEPTHGMYALKGDELRLCIPYHDQSSTRPIDFRPTTAEQGKFAPSDGVTTFTLRRVKDDASGTWFWPWYYPGSPEWGTVLAATIEQHDDRLGGVVRYADRESDRREAKLDGKIKGSDVTIEFDWTERDKATHLVCHGRRIAGTIEGRIEFPWEGKQEVSGWEAGRPTP